MAAITGGCLCGAIRYETDVAPIDTGYCHCRMCQRASGAPVLAWASFPIDAFRYTAGAPQAYVSSAIGVAALLRTLRLFARVSRARRAADRRSQFRHARRPLAGATGKAHLDDQPGLLVRH